MSIESMAIAEGNLPLQIDKSSNSNTSSDSALEQTHYLRLFNLGRGLGDIELQNARFPSLHASVSDTQVDVSMSPLAESGDLLQELTSFIHIAGVRGYRCIERWDVVHTHTLWAEEIQDLDDALEEAQEEEYLLPSQLGVNRAKELLGALHQTWRYPIAVSVTPYGEVSLHLKVRRGSSVLLLCDTHGEVLCLTNFGGRQESRKFGEDAAMPDQWIRDSLRRLEQRNS